MSLLRSSLLALGLGVGLASAVTSAHAIGGTEARVHWAFVPPHRPAVPKPRDATRDWRNPIDAFVRTRLKLEGLTPSPEADRVTLLRRVHLDLAGLPPAPSQVDAFIADNRPNAYELVVEQLLAAPAYGERWARWWLDAARYADSNGYSIDAPRSLWIWRDWVIHAFNTDQPFDQFIVEQLAGDLLPNATLSQRIATGFHRNTQINEEGGIDPEQFRVEAVIDRVNTTGTVLLGLTVGCAQCHDHKFDPISQREYFELFAFFNNQDEPILEVPRVQSAGSMTRTLSSPPLEGESVHAPAGAEPSPLGEDAGQAGEKSPPRRKKAASGVDTTLVLEERKVPRPTHVLIKGDFTRPGAGVSPGTPAVLHPFHPESAAGGMPPNRLDLARWIVDPANPLTARVLVNRVWQQFFGAGLVSTENDFGTQGAAPSHPQLLDWLATEWIRSGWSLKAIHRLIVSSATYRQSSNAREELSEADPANRLLARQNRLRLDAELIRDVALTASGRLDRRMGGPGVFPPQPEGVMNLGQSHRAWKVSEGGDRYRRGLYTFYWRATPHPALAVFDSPDAFSTCTRRLRSNTPLQALTLLNDSAFVDFADALAMRLTTVPDPADRMELGFRLCLSRAPRQGERERLQRLLSEERQSHGDTAAWQTFARVLLNLDETFTRE